MSLVSLGKMLLEWTGVGVGGGRSLASFVVVAESTCMYFTDRSPHRNGRQTVEI